MGGKFDERSPDTAITIWHNPRCTTSKKTLELLEGRGASPVVRNYLTDPPSEAEISGVLDKLDADPRALLRKKEKLYAELDLGREDLSRDELIRAMADNPRLIERPVVIRGDRAALGRPPESVAVLFE